MASELLVMTALVNCGKDAPTTEFMEGIAAIDPEVAVFRYQPSPGEIRASMEWQTVLGTAADLLAFAGVIWAAYERFVKPRREKHVGTQKPFLFLHVKHPDGGFFQVAIGNEVQDREVFVEQFVHNVTELRSQESEDGKPVLTKVSKNRSWVRIHVGVDRDS